MYKPFTEKTGIKINSADYNGGLAEIRAQSQSGNVTWDVVDLERQDLLGGCDEGLFETLDLNSIPPGSDGTPANKDFLPWALHECGIGNMVWSNIVAFDRSKFPGEKPSKLADFFDLKNFPGSRGLHTDPMSNLEWALMADGVAPDQVYKILSTKAGVNRAFAKLDTIKKSVIFWEAGAQPPQMLADGEVVMTTAYNGRILNSQIKENKPFEIIWDNQLYSFDHFAIVKGSKNVKEAMEFIRFATGSQPAADLTKWISYGPTRYSSVPLVTTYAGTDIQMTPKLPTAPKNLKTALLVDTAWWADNRDEMIKRFCVWMAK